MQQVRRSDDSHFENNVCKQQKIKYQEFKKLEEVYTNEIDLVKIINLMRQLKVAMKVLLTENQRKIIELASFRSLNQSSGFRKTILESLIKTDTKDRYNILCRGLNLNNEKLEGLSMDELNLLHEVLNIDTKTEMLNSSNISESRLIKNKIYPTIESQISLYEEEKSSN